MNQVPTVTYDFNGIKRLHYGQGFTAITSTEFSTFQLLKELERRGRWVEVRDVCEEQIQKTPEWLTPYLCAGVAHANLGRYSEAILRLAYVEKMARGNTDYSAATRVFNQLSRELETPRELA